MNEFPLPLTSNSPRTPEGTAEKSMRIYFRWEKKTQVITISSADFKLPVLFVASSFYLETHPPSFHFRCSASCPCLLLCDLPDRPDASRQFVLLCCSSSPTCSSHSPDLFLLFWDSLSDRWLLPPPRSSDAEYCFSSRSAMGSSSLDKPIVFPEMGGTW